ncbi:choline kinase [Candida albicans L26]|uniref:Bifunctional choline kinase/ethanolamine kinase n=4 Tax=Candida albicans TaxID=5476 RepID=A0A1D8PK80_CANAL|nr:bifunctional choline kinase/ethanolamine kinase [Candida albicans SC5314]KGR12912.1 choline kinase [Candida albicans P78048]KGR17640.1 choline kinase [Candida albicans P37037]KGT69644.1 choline kinase [Candida albicans 12C]KGU10957.1 choline kinase [Candida albicans 19F]KGU11493.1 choline kinase [Candida albicans L26]KGU31352.1 choline kinase [Candida albicans P75063]KHC55731.1 choline kinase [Candida albicans P37039]|eukprot:XP_714672.1 bifunctional choline kinase/ethanolamine kinase [Candida albicans SC5314]
MVVEEEGVTFINNNNWSKRAKKKKISPNNLIKKFKSLSFIYTLYTSPPQFMMEISPANIKEQSRSRSRSRTRNSTANSRSTSATRRPSLSSTHRRSLSSSSLNKLTITTTQVDQERSVPSVQVYLDNSLPLDFFKQDIIALTKTLKISKWHKRQLTINNLSINRISGALTNAIYKIEYHDESQNIHLPTLLLRVYGKNVDELIDRDNELAILIKLSQKRIGPRLLGIFSNGRFEQFLDGFITLNKEQIRDEILSQMLGRRMKDLHYKIELDAKDYESKQPTCWNLIDKWLKIFEQELLPGYLEVNYNLQDIFIVPFDQFKQIITKYKQWLFNKYDDKHFTNNYKFCHNDTQYGNLLLHESFNPKDIVVSTSDTTNSSNNIIDGEVTIKSTSNKKDTNLVVIDFEYSGANFPAYDIVNHFSEWMSDYHDPEKSYFIHQENYPNQLEQINLIKSYIEYDFQYPSSNLKTGKTPEDLINNTTNPISIIQYEIEKLYNECIYWRATVQIFWCLWGLIQNGPLKKPLNSNALSEQGINSTYNITVGGIENLDISDHTQDEIAGSNNDALIEEIITSSDDDFDYLKYANQKVALIFGDLIQFGIIDEKEVDEKYLSIIKYIDTKTFDI